MRFPVRLFGLLILGVLLGGCTLFPASQQEGTTPPSGIESSPSGAEGEASGVVELAVSGDEFSFSPEMLRVPRGARVRLTFTNTGRMPHTYTIDELGVDTGSVSGGGSRTVEFTAPLSAGSFTSSCAIPGHREQGMVGTLVIE